MLSGFRTFGSGLLVAALLATGCGVPRQDAPAPLQRTPAPSVSEPATEGVFPVRVYLVEEGRLVQALRTSADTSANSLLELLVEGPTSIEQGSGTTTAVAPGDFVVVETTGAATRSSQGVTVIDVPLEFTQIDGDLQLLATAQLVWTVTEPRPRGRVRMVFEGEVIELPTDRGLTSRPVRRSDFYSIAPVDAPDTSPGS